MTSRLSKADLLAEVEKSRVLPEQLEAKVAAAKRDPAARAEVLAIAEQARNLSQQIEAKLAEAAAHGLKTDWRDVARARNRDRYHFPRWLWIPIVAALISLFLLALYAAGTQ